MVRAFMDPNQSGGAIMQTPQACYANTNNSKGIANIHHNYIHHCKSDGYGYGVYCGFRGDAYSPTEEVYINHNTFANNSRDICRAKSNKLSLIFNNNTYSNCHAKQNTTFTTQN